MSSCCETELFHKDVVDELFPEAWGFWVALPLESVIDGEYTKPFLSTHHSVNWSSTVI
jgi:hypothetical protein